MNHKSFEPICSSSSGVSTTTCVTVREAIQFLHSRIEELDKAVDGFQNTLDSAGALETTPEPVNSVGQNLEVVPVGACGLAAEIILKSGYIDQLMRRVAALHRRVRL